MESLIEALRRILGEADFYRVLSGNNPTWDYSLMIEYMIGAVILLCVICNVFALLRCIFGGKK